MGIPCSMQQQCFAEGEGNKKSGSGADNFKPWKFLKEMEFLNPNKIIRNSKGHLPQERDEDDVLQTAIIEADVWSEGEEVDVPEQLVAVVEKRAGSEQGGKKHTKKKVDDNDDDIISLLRKKIERKPESPRMGFFNSIMPRVETLDDDRSQEFQLQTLQLLKKLCAEQNHQGYFYRQSRQHCLSPYNSFTPITSPVSRSMSAPSSSQSYYHPTTSTTLYPFKNPPQSQMSGQPQQSPLRSWQRSFQSTE
ncbi:hypothetical protein ElyMa_006702500 [Elysia marginata]|uniref:BESS domain-containing protein n=1 Tax=Elysia marginata TaxID=1093978 RepID=A0AAV4IUB3_9GAST|nr:hypothetical protein ElyMa_006702500 [Elysia marginata]